MNINMQELINYFYEIVTFDVFFKFSILYFFIIWIAILLWVIKDITNRTDNVYIQVLAICSILFLTPLGIFIYLLIRPGKTLFEKYYNEIEENLDIFRDIVEKRNKQSKGGKKCLKCETLLLVEWKICPYCGVKQKKKKNKTS